MKNLISGTLVILILVICSCKKDTAPGPGGSWTIKGRTFNTAVCANAFGTLAASSAVADSGAMIFSFGNGLALPTSSGTYVVSSGLSGTGANQVYISLSIGSFVSYSSSNSGTVAVTVNNGKINVQGTNIIMTNDNVATDSTAITFNITQTQ